MSSTNAAESTSGVGLGYGIAITVGMLVLISTIMLASYVCVRVKAAGVGGAGQHQITKGVSPEPMVLLGLDGSTIDSYPKLIVGESGRLPEPNNGPCPICLTDYKPNDTIRCMPDCNHCFHPDCVDEWLRMSPTCPLCRNSPAPSQTTTPSATPLSEVSVACSSSEVKKLFKQMIFLFDKFDGWGKSTGLV